jgi:hypothetical protein
MNNFSKRRAIVLIITVGTVIGIFKGTEAREKS